MTGHSPLEHAARALRTGLIDSIGPDYDTTLTEYLRLWEERCRTGPTS